MSLPGNQQAEQILARTAMTLSEWDECGYILFAKSSDDEYDTWTVDTRATLADLAEVVAMLGDRIAEELIDGPQVE